MELNRRAILVAVDLEHEVREPADHIVETVDTDLAPPTRRSSDEVIESVGDIVQSIDGRRDPGLERRNELLR